MINLGVPLFKEGHHCQHYKYEEMRQKLIRALFLLWLTIDGHPPRTQHCPIRQLRCTITKTRHAAAAAAAKKRPACCPTRWEEMGHYKQVTRILKTNEEKTESLLYKFCLFSLHVKSQLGHEIILL